MKITIIGPSASGKSTLARKISAQFDIPRIEIDRIWFKNDGHKNLNTENKVQKEIVSQKIQQEIEEFLAQNDEWVIDGTYSKIQPLIADQADVVVLIKRPLLARVMSHISRVLKGQDRHPEVTRTQDLFFINTIIKRWRKKENTKIEELADQFKDKLVVLKSFRDIDRYFTSLIK